MRIGTARKGGINSGWTVILVSVVIVAGIGILLWAPWDKPEVKGEIRIYCAAGMMQPVNETMEEYKALFPDVNFAPDFAGSGELLSKIRSPNAQGDLYLSADKGLMDKAVREGLVAEVIPIATIYPKLVVNNDLMEKLQKEGVVKTSADGNGVYVDKLSDLLNRKDVTLVIANEKLTAMGRLSEKILSAANLWQNVADRRDEPSKNGDTVTGATVNDTAVKIGATKKAIGIIWDITARQHASKMTIVEVESLGSYSEEVGIGVLTASKNPMQALRFARYLTARDKGMKKFAERGFETKKDADVWGDDREGVQPEITFYAGAMLKPGIDQTIQEFENREGVKINVSYDGCGVLVGKMRTINDPTMQAFPDAYLSCDEKFLEMVKHWFDAAQVISKNPIVLIVHNSKANAIQSIADLDGSNLTVGVTDPTKSALGFLTEKFLKGTVYYDEAFNPDGTPKHLSVSAGHELVNQVRTGALDVAIVYESNAKAHKKNLEHYKIVKIDMADALATQPFAINKDSKHKELMKRLLKAIIADQTKKRMRDIGFDIPDTKKDAGGK